MTDQVGPGTAQPHMFDVMTPDLVGIEDLAKRHDAIIARRDRLNAEAQLLTRWADNLKAREAAVSSEREAARRLGVSRRAVRKGKQQ